MCLTSEFTKKISLFYGKKGYVPGYHDIYQHRRVIDELIEENHMSLKDSFVEFTKIYKDPEKMLFEIYYDLFGPLIYNKLDRKEFNILDYRSKAQLVFINIPSFMKNRFFLFHFGFLAVHYGDKKTIELLNKYKPIEDNCLSIIKSFIF